MLEDSFENEFGTRKGEKTIHDKNQDYVENTEKSSKDEKGIKINKREIMNHIIPEEQLEKMKGELNLKDKEKKEKNEDIFRNFIDFFAKNKDFIKKEEISPKNWKGVENEWISRIDLILEGKMNYIEKKQIIWERESENDLNNVIKFVYSFIFFSLNMQKKLFIFIRFNLFIFFINTQWC